MFLGDVLANQGDNNENGDSSSVHSSIVATLLASSEDRSSHLINPHISGKLYERAFQRVMTVGVSTALKRSTTSSSSLTTTLLDTVTTPPQLSLAHRLAKRWMENLQSSSSSLSRQAPTTTAAATPAPVVAVPSVSVLRGLGLLRSSNTSTSNSAETPFSPINNNNNATPINSSSVGGDAIVAASVLLGLPTPDALLKAGMPPSAVYTIFLTSARKTQRRVQKLIASESSSVASSTTILVSSATSRKSGGSGRTVIATVNMRIAWAVQRALSIWEGYYLGCVLSSVLGVDDPLTLFLRRNSWGLPGGEGSGDTGGGATSSQQQQQLLRGDQTATYRTLPLVRE